MNLTFKIFLSSLLLLGMHTNADDILPDLIVNYGDFSFINSVALGFDYVYFGTTNGVIQYNIKRNSWEEPLTGYPGLRGRQILEVKAAHDDNEIWAKTEFGIFEFNRTFDYWIQVDAFPADEEFSGKHISPDPFYTPPVGYNYFPDGTLTDVDGRNYPLTDILDDGWSNLWIGSWGLGAFHASDAILRLEMLKYGLPQSDVSTIYLDDGRLITGGESINSYRPNMAIFDWRQNSFEYVESGVILLSGGENIHDIIADKNYIYAATDNGVWIIEKKSLKLKDRLRRSSGLPDNQVSSLLLLGDTLLAGTKYGVGIIELFPDSAEQGLKNILPSLSIRVLEKIGEAIWIGASNGLYRMDIATGKLSLLSIAELSETSNINDIAFYGSKAWVASDDNLISIDINTAEVTPYPEVYSYGFANTIAVVDSILAVGTPNGLLLLGLGKKQTRQFFTKNDGLWSIDIKDLIFDGDYLWIGADMGLSRLWYKNPAFQR
jgi:ligand-binding sensor domain-containing protein